jgi:hypothetical protein
MCRLTPATSKSAKNAFGQEAFRHKGGKAPVEQSPTTSAADISSHALGAAEVVASEVGKVDASGAQQVEGLQSDLCMAGPPLAQELQAAEVGRPGDVEEDDRCMYVETPLEDDVISDRHDIDEFKAAQRIITRTLSVSTLHRPC